MLVYMREGREVEQLKNAKWKIIALLLVAGLGILAAILEQAFPEGNKILYVILDSPKFIEFFGAVFIVCFVTALYKETETKFFVWLLVLGFFIGVITQMVGTTNDLWAYKRSFVFGGISWALAAVTMFGISLVIRKKALKKIDNKAYNVVALVIIFLVIPVLLGKVRSEVKLTFWVYYFALFTFALIATYRSSFSALVSCILAAWVMGLISEYMGSSIGLWKFCDGKWPASIACWFPPPYLVFGCWPLEFLTQKSLSSFISKEATVRSE